MKLKLKNNYLSIKKLNTEELNDFTLITGSNGIGKTHLLNGIKNGNIELDVDNNHILKNYIKLHNYNSISNVSSKNVDIDAIGKELEQLWKEIKRVRKQFLTWLNSYLKSNEIEIEINNFEDYKKIFEEELPDKNKSEVERTLLQYESNLRRVKSSYVNDSNRTSMMWSHISNFIDYSLVFINIFDFWKCYLSFRYNEDILKITFDEYFIKYRSILRQNSINQIDNIEYVQAEELINKLGKEPWVVLQEKINKYFPNYKIIIPDIISDKNYYIRFINEKNGDIINLNSLSSGEKVIFSLILSLFYDENTIDFNDDTKILLLDEIDASLHPSMVKTMLKIINEIFIGKFHLKVIMTTHSPTTVALADENSIYCMEDDNGTKIVKRVNKDKALSILLNGVNSISIDYKNRRQVFVEDESDRKFYESIWGKVKSKFKTEVSLNFISFSKKNNNGETEDGGCSKIQEIVSKLAECGAKNIYGITDWDCDKKTKNNVFILGENKRHSIENYIYDPIYLAMFVIDEIPKLKKKYSLNEEEKFYDIISFDNDRVQEIVDSVLSEIEKKIDNLGSTDLVECNYFNEIKINLPKWYLEFRGHDLEELIKDTFFNGKKHSIRKEILEKIVYQYPEVISLDFVDLFGLIIGDKNYKSQAAE